MWANDQDRFTHDKIEMYVDTSVEAECTFDTRIEIDADGFWMNQENVEALNEGFGSLKDEFTCEFYSDENYSNKITASSIVNMGKLYFLQESLRILLFLLVKSSLTRLILI